MLREVFIPGEGGYWGIKTPDQKMDIVQAIKHATDSNLTKHIAETLREFTKDQEVRESLIPEMVREGNNYARALLLSEYTSDDLPEQYRSQLAISIKPEINAKPELAHNRWTLCKTSEAKMLNALSDFSTIMVGGLMIKFFGRTTALCFESFATKHGTFIEGNFYSPDSETQSKLKESFLLGVNCPELSLGSWFLMRGITPDPNGDALSEAKKRSKNMLAHIPRNFGSFNRAEYLDKGEAYPD